MELRTYTLSQLTLRNNYFRERNRFALTVRELAWNALGYGASSVKIYSLYHDDKYYLIFLHNGEPFDDLLHILKSMTPSTSCGQRGVQGNGMKLAAFLLTDLFTESELLIYSKCKNGKTVTLKSYVKNTNDAVIDDVSDEWNKVVEEACGPDFYDETKVAYIIRFTNKDTKSDRNSNSRQIGICQAEYMRLAISICDAFNHLTVRYGNRTVLGRNQKIKSITEHGKSALTGKLTAQDTFLQLHDNTTFKSLYMDKSQTFKVPNVFVKCRDLELVIDTEADLEIYPGVVSGRTGRLLYYNAEACQRLNLKRGSFRHDGTPNPVEKIYLINESFNEDLISKNVGRIKVDPYFSTNYSNFSLSLLGLPSPDYSGGGADERVKDFKDLDKHECYRDFLSKEENNKRKPFLRAFFRITAIRSIKSNQEFKDTNDPIVQQYYLGGINEFFDAIDSEIPKAIIQAICLKMLETNSGELAQFKQFYKFFFPFPEGEWCPLPVNVVSTKNKIDAWDAATGKIIREIDPGTTKSVILKYEDGSLVTHLATSKSPGVYLSKLAAGTYMLSVCPLSRTDGTEIPEDEYKHSKNFMPKKYISIGINGEKYALTLKVNIPKTHGGGGGRSIGEIINCNNDDAIDQDRSPTISLGTPHPYVQYVSQTGVTYLNEDNRDVEAIFKFPYLDYPQLLGRCKNFYRDISEKATKFYKSLEDTDITKFVGEEKNKLEEDYLGDPKLYLLNVFLSREFENKEVERLREDVLKTKLQDNQEAA